MAKLPKGMLATSKKGSVLANGYNALMVVSHDLDLENCITYNTFSGLEIITKPPPLNGFAPQPGPYPRVRTDADAGLIRAYINQHHIPQLTYAETVRAIKINARGHSFHPVLDWLKTLQWDGKPRIDNWLFNAFDPKCAGEAHRLLLRAFAAKFLIAAVRRILHPGSKFDTMLILEGAQGLGKSLCCKALFGEWFTDDVPHDFANKDAPMSLLGVWGVELSEIAQITANRAGTETVKAFLSRPVDRFRPPYGENFLHQPRQMVFIGTTNHRDWAYGDETGNRRFWPVACRAAAHHWITVNRDQLFAEALVREATGEEIHLTSEEMSQEAIRETEERRDEDPWTDAIRHHLVGISETKTKQCLEVIGLQTKDWTILNQKRCARILRALNWEQIVTDDKSTGSSKRIWRKAEKET